MAKYFEQEMVWENIDGRILQYPKYSAKLDWQNGIPTGWYQFVLFKEIDRQKYKDEVCGQCPLFKKQICKGLSLRRGEVLVNISDKEYLAKRKCEKETFAGEEVRANYEIVTYDQQMNPQTSKEGTTIIWRDLI
jgi:hypothetical protein